MPQIASLIQTLKTCLKSERKTYADVAMVLGLTEASVKRLFAQRDFTLERLEVICQMLGMELSDLVRKMNESRLRVDSLNAQQEREITEDLVLLMVTVCIFSHWTVEHITDYYAIDEGECVSKLLKLDQLGLIELLPGNRVRLLISPNFKWLENGPIHQFFRKTIGPEFFATGFDKDGACLLVLNAMLSEASGADFRQKLERLAKEFSALGDQDASLPFGERRSVTLVMAMRDWEYGLFQHMKRRI